MKVDLLTLLKMFIDAKKTKARMNLFLGKVPSY